MRVTTVFALALFLVPTVYVVKYYAVDKPREERILHSQQAQSAVRLPPKGPDLLLYWENVGSGHADPAARTAAAHEIGSILRQPGINYKRPLECLTAKATLADLATQDSNPAVRAAASEELGKVAQGGAVIRR